MPREARKGNVALAGLFFARFPNGLFRPVGKDKDSARHARWVSLKQDRQRTHANTPFSPGRYEQAVLA